MKAALYEFVALLVKDREGCPLPSLSAQEAGNGRPVLARMALGRSLGPLQQCQPLLEDT